MSTARHTRHTGSRVWHGVPAAVIAVAAKALAGTLKAAPVTRTGAAAASQRQEA
ncbi:MULTISPECIES: hypothetical protein [Saccharothrix]|uniref:hypothetical protein n=1 Tax=Saccharothrix TaxID=2071 RepID=UPI001301447F|nr:hypothetical protein [Saccharothrix sp. CB00851]